VAKLLIDECLHTSLLELAHAAGHIADHVTYLGLVSSKDRELVKLSVERDYIFVTNNRSDFLALYRRTPLHAGLVIIVPNVKPALQRQLFETALGLISERNLVNTVIEVVYSGEKIECRQYPLSLGFQS
jgi:predicted nuclease of predicted toxin-antitoxin system